MDINVIVLKLGDLFQTNGFIYNIRGYFDMGKIVARFRLLTWTSLIGQFGHSGVGRGEWGKGA